MEVKLIKLQALVHLNYRKIDSEMIDKLMDQHELSCFHRL